MKYISLLLSIVLGGCGHISIPVDSGSYQDKTGIVVTASHLKEQTFLYLNDGLQVMLNDSDPELIPWGEFIFIEREAGFQRIRAWYNYTGKSGEVNDCVILTDGGVLLLEYQAPFTSLQDGKIAWQSLTPEVPVSKC